MTLSTTASRAQYPGAGSTGPFAFPFKVFAAADLTVTKRTTTGTETPLNNITDWVATGIGQASGSITLNAPLAVGESLSIRRNPPLTQGTSIRNLGQYFAGVHEDEFDTLVTQIQALKDRVDRSFGVSETYDPAALTLVVKPETGKVLGWDSTTVLTNKTLDSSAVALPGQGRTVATLSAFLANNAVVNLLDFGGADDDVTDNYPAYLLAAAALPETGGVIVAPVKSTSSKYYFSQTPHFIKPIHLIGALGGQPVPAGTVGTAFDIAADHTGIQIEGRDTFGDTFTFPNARSLAGLGGAEYSVIENITIISRGGQTGLANGGTGVPVDGVRVRARCTLRNVWIDGFSRNSIRQWATSGSGDPSLNGNTNLCRYINVSGMRSGSDNLSIFGADANAGLISLCDFSVGAARGIYDGSLLGNAYDAVHLSGNTGRCIETDNINARSSFRDCYVEGAGSLSAAQQAKILSPSYVLGGILGTDPGTFTSDTTALVITSDGRLVRKGLQHINSKGATTIGISLGKDTATQTAMVMGSGDSNIPNEDIELMYGGSAIGWWDWRDNGTSSRAFFSFPNRTLIATLRAYAPAFRNGLFHGAAGSGSMIHFSVGAAPPVAGTWVKADRKWNDYTTSGTASGIEYWYEQTAGTPGTWVPNRAFGTLTLGAAVTTTINNTAVIGAGSRIFFAPTNAAAGTLQAGANAVYISAKTANTSFALTTAGGGLPVGTETYDYVIFN